MELEGPEWLDGEKARDDPEAGQERGLRGGGEQSTLDPGTRAILTARLGGEGSEKDVKMN